MSRFPAEYGDSNRYPARGGCQWYFPPLNYDAYRQHHGQTIYASGYFTCCAKAAIVDGEYCSVRFNLNQIGQPSSYFGTSGPEVVYLFEFDPAGDGVTPGSVQVNISADVTATQVRDRLLAAMVATFAGGPLKAEALSTQSIAVFSPIRWADLQLNEYVNDAGFTIPANVRAPVIRPAVFGAGPLRGWHRFNLRANQVGELPVDIGSPVF